jgi:methylmalonyl-CoA mutase cobalamin-binding domain/chain
MKKGFKDALLEFDKIKAEEIISQVQVQKQTNEAVFGLISETLADIGEEWQKGDIALSQIYMVSRICDDIIEKQFANKPSFRNSDKKIAIATFMDYHLLGKKIVLSTLLSCGFNVKDFQIVSSAEELVQKTVSNNIDILLISTLMYHSAIKIKNVKEMFLEANNPVKIIVGGAPFIFDSELWKAVGADAMGYNGSDAVDIVNQWVGRN